MHTWEIHPAVVHFPIAFLLGGVVLDLFGRHSEAAVAAATYLLLAGLATAAVTAATGVFSYYTVPGNHTEQAHQRIFWHIGAMVTAVVLFTVVCFVRWQHPSVVSLAIRGPGLAAAAILIFGGYVGGKLVYQGGLGIDPAILKAGLRSKSDTTCAPAAGSVEALRQARRALRKRERRAATRGDGVASPIHPSRASPAV
jgi:uncharacterized membrane protein